MNHNENEGWVFFREFWKYDPENSLKDYYYDSDESEPEIKALFRNEVRTEVIELNLKSETKTPDTSNNIPKRNKTPEFLVQMRKRQMIRAEKREEIRKVHVQKAEEKKRQVYWHILQYGLSANLVF